MNPTSPENQIKTYFQTRPEVVAVYIFGSYATGKERTNSDIDIAVLIDQKKEPDMRALRSTYHTELSRITRKDLDLIIMNTAGEGLLKQIYKRGRQILTQDNTKLSIFNMIAYTRIAEFGYYHGKMQAGVIKSIAAELPIG